MYRAYKWVGVGALLSGLLLVSTPSRGQAGEPQEKVRETIDAVLVVLQDKSLQGPGKHGEAPGKNAPGGVSAFWV